MPVAWLIATGITSLTGAVLVGRGDGLLIQAAIQTSAVGSSLPGGQAIDTANINNVRQTYGVVQHQSSWWPSNTSVALATPATVPLASLVDAIISFDLKLGSIMLFDDKLHSPAIAVVEVT